MEWWIILLIVIGCLIVLYFLLFILIGIYFIKTSLKRRKEPFSFMSDKFLRNEEFVEKYKDNIVTIKSFDNLNLKGHLILNSASKNFIIMAHGYKGSYLEHSYLASKFYENGYNILLISHRTHDESEGKYITMGYLEKFDVYEWIKYLNKNYKNINIILYGWSMGAATILGTTKLISANDNLKCIVADSSYTSTYEQFLNVFKKYMSKLPKYQILFWTSILAKIFMNMSFNKDQPIKCVKNSAIPTLFIHGEDDDFVLPYMEKELFNNSSSKIKEEKSFSKSGHCMSLSNHPDEYLDLVLNFISKNI